MYPYEGQPIDAALDENGQPAIHSSYPQAANFDLDYQQPQHTTPSYFLNVPGPASQGSGLGNQTSPSALFPYTPESLSDPNYPGGASQFVFPDPQFVDDPSTSFVDDPSTASINNQFQFTLDPPVGYHLMYNPFSIPHQESRLPHQFPQHYPMFPPPIVSFDGTSTLAPGSVDIGPLREPVHLGESLSLGDSVQIKEPLPPCPSGSQNPQPPERSFEFKHWPYPCVRPKLRGLTSVQGAASSTASLRSSRISPLVYNSRSRIHRKIFEDAREELIRSSLRTGPFLTEHERKSAAQDALLLAANAIDEVHGSRWSAENLTAFYKSFTALPSADIMSTCKKTTRAVVEISMAQDLIGDPLHPFKYIFGNDSGDQVVLEYRLGSAVAVECALQELASGRPNMSIDFGVHNFKHRYNSLLEYIRDHIKPNAELSARWEAFKTRVAASYYGYGTSILYESHPYCDEVALKIRDHFQKTILITIIWVTNESNTRSSVIPERSSGWLMSHLISCASIKLPLCKEMLRPDSFSLSEKSCIRKNQRRHQWDYLGKMGT
ncbi:hypothetical protein EDD22DRAFT_850212 [Suillus occidentalis]|nr:hypothetical protein EDD22DRAFT_850212 [Suillus occidentalis]